MKQTVRKRFSNIWPNFNQGTFYTGFKISVYSPEHFNPVIQLLTRIGSSSLVDNYNLQASYALFTGFIHLTLKHRFSLNMVNFLCTRWGS